MIILLMGAPGVGKGTQSAVLARELKIPHISMGDILRENVKNQTPIGVKAETFMKMGHLVPDEVILEIINDRIVKKDCVNGFILDGFPRTINQAQGLDELLKSVNKDIKAVFNIELDYQKLLERIVGRRVCKSCGATYHVSLNKSRVENICDECATELTQRKDDTEDTFNSRMEEYTNQTEPLINFYSDKGLLIRIDADGDKNEITKKIINSLGVND